MKPNPTIRMVQAAGRRRGRVLDAPLRREFLVIAAQKFLNCGIATGFGRGKREKAVRLFYRQVTVPGREPC